MGDFWSGRWESNPTPIAAKLLIPLVQCDWLASNSVQLCSYSLDRFPIRIAHNVTVNLKRGACICRAGVAFGQLSAWHQSRAGALCECDGMRGVHSAESRARPGLSTNGIPRLCLRKVAARCVSQTGSLADSASTAPCTLGGLMGATKSP